MNLWSQRRRSSPNVIAFGLLAASVAAGCGGGESGEPPTTSGGPVTVATGTTSPLVSSVASTTELVPTTASPVWEPVGVGEFGVGATKIILDDPVRPLTVEVWFPLDPAIDTADRTPQRYSFTPTVYIDSSVAVAATAADMATDQAFPLVVYSHGSGGLRYINATFTETIASHGYVVVAADHTGNTAVDTIAGTEMPATMFSDRVDDVRRLIDAFTSPAADSPTAGLAAGVDPELIAVTGHSFGGWTAIASAVGSDEPPGASAGDPRIDAIVPIAPAVTGLFTEERLAGLTQPMLVLVGTDDTSTPPSPHVDELWNQTANSPAFRVELDGAEHQSFTDVCLYQADLPKLPEVPEVVTEAIDGYATQGCEPDDMPWQRAHELAATYTIDFLDLVLVGDTAAMPVVVPDDVTVVGR